VLFIGIKRGRMETEAKGKHFVQAHFPSDPGKIFGPVTESGHFVFWLWLCENRPDPKNNSSLLAPESAHPHTRGRRRRRLGPDCKQTPTNI
jgi:hypothetical protein